MAYDRHTGLASTGEVAPCEGGQGGYGGGGRAGGAAGAAVPTMEKAYGRPSTPAPTNEIKMLPKVLTLEYSPVGAPPPPCPPDPEPRPISAERNTGRASKREC